MNAPSLTVVVPVHEAEAYVAEAIESLLEQTLPPDEILVVDDGSTDTSVAIVERLAGEHPSIRLVLRANGGPAAARNSGLAAVRTELVAFHDADDVALPDWLRSQVARLLADPALTGVIGRQDVFVEPDAPTPVWLAPPPGWLPPGADLHVRHHLMNMVVRRSAFDAVGVFDESMRFGEDADLVLRMRDAGLRVELVDDLVVRRRVHAGNVTHDAEAFRRAQFEILARRIRRRKAQG